jgi:hypothetical protein
MSRQQEILGKYQETLLRKHLGHDVESDDDDELLELLEDDTEFDHYRAQRLQELSQQYVQNTLLESHLKH